MESAAPGRSDIEMLARFAARVLGKTAFVLAIPLLVTVVYVRCLRATGELLPPSAIAALSTSADRIIWLTGYYDTGFLHKTDVARVIAPRVAVVGSSRVMQMRAKFFSGLTPAAFYNLGGCCTSILEAQRTIHRLATVEKRARPDVVLLGVDSWWFESPIEGRTALRSIAGPFGLAVNAHRTAIDDWMSGVADRIQVLQQAWRDPRFQSAVRGHFEPLRDTSVNALLVGISARANRSGFRNDGSYRYGTRIEAQEGLVDSAAAARLERGFSETNVGEQLEASARYIMQDNVRILEDVAREADASGIRLIVFIAPIAPLARDHLESRETTREFISRLSAALSSICDQHGVPFLDALDGRRLGARDGEFYDWAHPSERLTARLVVQLFHDPKAGPILARYGDPRTIEADLATSTRRWQLYDF